MQNRVIHIGSTGFRYNKNKEDNLTSLKVALKYITT